MAKIKSYTDFPQSEALSKILSHESADMWYHGHGSPLESDRVYDEEPASYHSAFPQWDKPCWSLTALLEVLPYGYSSILTKSFNGKDYYCEIDGKPLETMADNPVDACVEMIIKLKELNLL